MTAADRDREAFEANQYRKKPVVIEARQFCATSLHEQEALANWCGGLLRGTKLPPDERVIRIPTLEGEMEASFGDWIICGIKGEFYPCKPDIFAATYEPSHAREAGAQEPVAVPAGWKLVPVDATDEMIEAAWDSDAADYVGEHKRIHCLADAWTAMLAAAPVSPQPLPTQPAGEG